jgi:osmotically-inducible protein OsmY
MKGTLLIAESDTLQQPASLPTESQEDLHLAGRLARALHETGYGTLCNIEVTVQAREVTLTGRVPSYYLKQVAQSAALNVSGIHQIRNDLEVA